MNDKCSNCYIVDRAKRSYCPDCKKVKKTSQDTPTVNVLNKIRNEFEHYNIKLSNYRNMISIDTVLQIIDKYITAERNNKK